MEATVSEIQVESKDEKRPTEVSPQDERQEEKASMLCFKRRKKAAKEMKPKASSKAAGAARTCPPEAGASDQPQPPGGAWASIKRLVTHRKRSASSKQQKPFEAQVQPEISAEDTDLSKKKAKSRLKIPCIKFSKGEKRSSRSKITEDSDCSLRVQGEAERLGTEALTIQLDDQAATPKLPQDVSKDVSEKGGDEVCEPNVSNRTAAPGEKVIAVELGSDTGHPAIHTGTLVLERDTETTEEERRVQPQQASPLETSETHQLPVVSDVPPLPAIPDQQSVEEAKNNILESGPNQKQHESEEIVAEGSEPKDTELSQESELRGNEVTAEKPKPEESKRMEPIAIIITDTEISEFDVKKSKNVPKQFLISIENEQIGVFANDSGFEGRTSEQYETLLKETASSLVKNAIQLSIEQLINEMGSDDNKINNLLQ
ncbi:A-kinase anchor protein 5 [Suricata suricatta]|uniref:A-kinase anchoring protein 5 n=1 Tax=Suricata suricatta TaxID=37032 RepID=A0A673U5M8_SURSU|nr:A-kinase anchor protein 5 [Suricata suricatta]XP_029807557.1 A-kinase anchor protein 5 [Suricata suricatta]